MINLTHISGTFIASMFLLFASQISSQSITSISGKSCKKGGIGGTVCSSNCPPCWTKYSDTEYHCFDYDKSKKCQFDWVDVSKLGGSDSSGSKPDTPSKSTSSKSSSSPPSSDPETSGDEIPEKPKPTSIDDSNGSSKSTRTVITTISRSRSSESNPSKLIDNNDESGAQTKGFSLLLTGSILTLSLTLLV